MNWRVTSTIHGGSSYSAATREQYAAAVTALRDRASALRREASSWQTVRQVLQSDPKTAAAMQAHGAGGGTAPAGHVAFPYARVFERCADHARECRAIGDELERMASLIARAHSLYSQAESKATQGFRRLVSIVDKVAPGSAGLAALLMATSSFMVGSVKDGKPNLARATDGLQVIDEELVSSLAGWMTIGQDGQHKGAEVAGAAEMIAQYSSRLKNLAQGDTLTVREVTSRTEVARASHSVASSLENLRRLAEERLGKIDLDSGLDYATVAIQEYRREDGTSGWLVLIPGTDGKFDSPFGWAQNLELMSADPEHRRQADSFRMVEEAMRQAGIGADEPVALVGHSQGGIVAASLAADLGDRYSIEHVVTAGSPIANHPIPSKTWVTSIEIKDEVIAALDGNSNPATDHWLTIQGDVRQATGESLPQVRDDGSCVPGTVLDGTRNDYSSGALVEGAAVEKELTHWLKYHQAAYRDASDLGSAAVDEHERHFSRIIDGELVDTRYYEGRMSR
ncbi:PGAP1-like alpha/beta domain-containing protein [Bifidobacterium leontopitheci]|uniref:GPI inositol-deacylase PGAP1-like alpha/beta domain-containing protein n=1 Tax=Bifidobacterium leontopitheci TaxID=2650774 RepID=A0A6I1GPG9_9BIFI|nr:alpha/beta hydrolase [Bifidobacterium leontopitheci]KAB7791406.1 hypothetical protein F7D09_0081 [Bifidobacterium leontopitheci]